MPKISFGGMMSGLPPNIVEQIMAAERVPIQNMQNKKGNIESKLTLVTDFESRVRSVKDNMKELFGTRGFKDYALNLSREGIIAGSIDPSKASTGDWSIEVKDLPENAGVMTNGFPDRDRTQVGVGYIKFDTSEGTKEVYINDTNNTLNGVVNAINSAQKEVKASVVRDAEDSDFGYKLILTSDEYGRDNNIDFPTVYLLDGDHDFYFDKSRDSKNGVVSVNGFDIEVDQKKLEDLIPGVTLDLLSAEPGREVNISVSEDFEVITGKIDEFVKSMNSVLSFIQAQNTMDETTDTSKTLGGDSMLRSVENRFRRVLQSVDFSSKSQVNRLSAIGVEFNRNGTLNFNREKFDNVLKSKPLEVVKFLRGSGDRTSGFINKVKRLVDDSLNSSFGLISNRKKGLNNRIERIDRNIENKEKMLVRKEDSLRRKFGRLEEQMGRLQAQGSAIGATVAGPGIGR